jgi:hypothetical protein
VLRRHHLIIASRNLTELPEVNFSLRKSVLNAGKCGVEVEGSRMPTSDWILNLQILTSGGYRYAPEPPHH